MYPLFSCLLIRGQLFWGEVPVFTDNVVEVFIFCFVGKHRLAVVYMLCWGTQVGFIPLTCFPACSDDVEGAGTANTTFKLFSRNLYGGGGGRRGVDLCKGHLCRGCTA